MDSKDMHHGAYALCCFCNDESTIAVETVLAL